MSTLIVVGFKKDMFRASKVLNELVDMNYDWTIDLHDAVAAYRDYNGKLRIDASYQMTTGEGAALGGLFGSLVGLTLGAIAAPVTAGASAAAAAGVVAAGAVGGALGAAGGALDAKWWKEDFGIPEDFVQDVGDAGPARRLGDLCAAAFGRSHPGGRAVRQLWRCRAVDHAHPGASEKVEEMLNGKKQSGHRGPKVCFVRNNLESHQHQLNHINFSQEAMGRFLVVEVGLHQLLKMCTVIRRANRPPSRVLTSSRRRTRCASLGRPCASSRRA